MTPAWPAIPQFKLEIGSITYTNDQAFNIQLVRPENNVSNLILQVSDFKSEKYIDVFDTFDAVDLSFGDGSSWTKVFTGVVTTAKPSITKQGEVLEIGAWGLGQALVQTHCRTSYGVESANPTKDTPKEIWQDIIDNQINKSFGGAVTGYAIGKTKVADIQSGLSITNVTSPYQDNFTLINRVCDLVTAYAAEQGPAEDGCHWFVDPSGDLYINTLGAHEEDGSGWDTYFGGSQADSTIVVGQDMILYDFRKNIEEYANKIVLASNLRKPAYDRWTEYDGVGAGGKALWGHTGDGHIALTDDNTVKIVGSYSVRVETPDTVGGFFWYPSSQDLLWNINNISSENTLPYLSFYGYRNDTLTDVSLTIVDDDGDSVNCDIDGYLTDEDHWYYIQIPIGEMYNRTDFDWTRIGTLDWTKIDYFSFGFATANNTHYFYIDDMHITGKIVRQAFDSGEIGAPANRKEYQRVIRNDVALSDSMSAADATGIAARLAYAELLRRMQTPLVGIIQTSLAIDALPGQLVHIHACQKSDGTFRVDKDMRCVELKHYFNPPPVGAFTHWNLTDDLANAHAFGAPTRASMLAKYAGALGHAEARDLKGSGIDILIPKLSKDYA